MTIHPRYFFLFFLSLFPRTGKSLVETPIEFKAMCVIAKAPDALKREREDRRQSETCCTQPPQSWTVPRTARGAAPDTVGLRHSLTRSQDVWVLSFRLLLARPADSCRLPLSPFPTYSPLPSPLIPHSLPHLLLTPFPTYSPLPSPLPSPLTPHSLPHSSSPLIPPPFHLLPHSLPHFHPPLHSSLIPHSLPQFHPPLHSSLIPHSLPHSFHTSFLLLPHSSLLMSPFPTLFTPPPLPTSSPLPRGDRGRIKPSLA